MHTTDAHNTQVSRREVSLTDMETGETGLVIRLGSGLGVQERLRSLGILEGQRVKKLSGIGKVGPVVVLVDRAQVAVGHGMARRIIVQVGA